MHAPYSESYVAGVYSNLLMWLPFGIKFDHFIKKLDCYAFSFIDTFILQNCEVTSPSVGTIRVSCDSSHQIQINAICRDNNCNNRAVTSNGYSPFTITGFDPGKEYAVSIHVFDGNQVVLNIGITKIIRVIYTISKICNYTNSCI